MLCPKCGFEQDDDAKECQKCGVIFGKVHAHPQSPPVIPAAASPAQKSDAEPAEGLFALIKEFLLPQPKDVNHIIFVGRVVVFIGLVVWGYRFITNTWQATYVMESFMHNINLPFHEAGHIFFSPFGRFMTVLGGSLMQLLIPLICFGAFLYPNRNPFAAAAALWWFAENLMDLAPYIGDARAGELPLLGGVTGSEVEDYHDWEYLLKTLGWLYYDHKIAAAAYTAGRWLMVLAFLWGARVLWMQYKNLEKLPNVEKH